MVHRWLFLAGLAPLLLGCGTGNPATSSAPGGAGPYDTSDKFLDAKGFPLPGWEYVRDSAGGSSM
jgi:hypothetical protein